MSGSRRRSTAGAVRWALAAGAAATVATMLVLAAFPHGPVAGDTSLAGSQGTDVSQPATPSAVTVAGRGIFSTLQVTVNQTDDLNNQALSVKWSGGAPTFTDPVTGRFLVDYGGDYLQLMECWGADDGEVPSNPGPPPEQCEFGGQNKNTGAYPANPTLAYTRIISRPTWTCGPTSPPGCLTYTQEQQAASSTPAKAYEDTHSHNIYDPFKAVDGTTVNESVNSNCCNGAPPFQSFDTNPYFSYNTTNEVDFARTFADGTGQALFTVDTGEEAPGLGCGQSVQPNPDGSTSTPQCWLVIVPRGTPVQENMDGDGINQTTEVDTSPLTPTAWANRIAIPLKFNPIGSSCPIGGNIRRIVGSELAAPAAASWQPVLCGISGNPPYSYASLSDDNARNQLTGAVSGGAGMAVMSNPVDPSLVDPANPVTYAPLTLSGVTIGFNIERQPATGTDGQPLPDQAPLAGTHVVHIYLTPRLVAKLLTESYRGQFVGLPTTNLPTGYTWLANNPVGLIQDPDFIQFNPEFAELTTSQPVDSSGLVVEEPSADAAAAVWQWIFADKEATDWLAGAPDPWKMTVNPNYDTSNSTSILAGVTSIDQFKKADPYCFNTGVLVGNPQVPARPLCMQDWSPYVNTMRDAAAAVRNANSGAKTAQNEAATNSSTAWKSTGPQVIGQRFIMSVTDTADAARYGLQMAALSRAGDDTSTRTFVAPDANGLAAGEQAMVASPVQGVLAPNPSTTAAGAYPLTMLTYAAVMPVGLDDSARHDYASFITYAVGAGQAPGLQFGQLPPGYVSLPSDLVAEANAAVTTILNPPTTTTTTTTTTAEATTTTETPTTFASAEATGGPATGSGSPPSEPSQVPAPSGFQPGSSTAATPPATAPPTATTGPPPLLTASTQAPSPVATGRSPHTTAGLVRLLLPAALLVGLLAGGGAFLIAMPRDSGAR